MPSSHKSNTKVWTDVTLLTLSENQTPYGMIKNGAIIARKGKIDWVGKADDLPDLTNDVEIISCDGHYMTPGLIDCHTHLIYGGNIYRGNRIAEFEKYRQGTGYGKTARKDDGIITAVHATRAADEQSLKSSAEKRLQHLQKGGVTTVEIKSGHGLDLGNELKMLRVARSIGKNSSIDVVTTFLGAHVVPPEFHGDAGGYMDYVTGDMLDAVVAENLADAVDASCENSAFSLDQIERLLKRSQQLGLNIKLHAEQLSNNGGAKLAARYGALSADHLEWLDEDGVKAMALAGTVAVLLPGAFYTLRHDHIPPVDLLRDYKVPMAIASDSNPGSSPVLSLGLMVNMASNLFQLTPEESLIGVTRNGAKALGLNDRGTLEVGKKADFAIWDINHPTELSYQLGGNSCSGIVKNGEAVKFAGP